MRREVSAETRNRARASMGATPLAFIRGIFDFIDGRAPRTSEYVRLA
ncbi:MAG TPA: hypothetical protein VHZ27_03250 [Solirubrobacteraceae bacterium]|nr:hypothetical protein [Solirubrobacteraceae bacterium]